MIRRFELETYEKAYGEHVGRGRFYESPRQGYEHRRAGHEDPLNKSIMGAIGEVAFCKACGLYKVVNGFNIYPVLKVNSTGPSSKDIGKNIQVKTRSFPGYRLLVPPSIVDDDIVVSVIRGTYVWTVVGWMLMKDVRVHGTIENPRNLGPAYFVEDEKLRDISEIPPESFEGVEWP